MANRVRSEVDSTSPQGRLRAATLANSLMNGSLLKALVRALRPVTTQSHLCKYLAGQSHTCGITSVICTSHRILLYTIDLIISLVI